MREFPVKEYEHIKRSDIFEGEYKNGRRNGKGKEYNNKNSKIIQFEGEYENGKRHGKGKVYYYYGELKYEGNIK